MMVWYTPLSIWYSPPATFTPTLPGLSDHNNHCPYRPLSLSEYDITLVWVPLIFMLSGSGRCSFIVYNFTRHLCGCFICYSFFFFIIWNFYLISLFDFVEVIFELINCLSLVPVTFWPFA